MKLIRHFVASFVVMGVLISLVLGIYNSTSDNYGFEDTYTGEVGDDNLAERLNNIGLVNRLGAVSDALATITTPDSSKQDLIGALMITAFSPLLFVFDLVFLPFEIIGAITNFYYIPDIVKIGIVALIIIYIGFIYTSAKLRGDV